jgi:hypothetical protein
MADFQVNFTISDDDMKAVAGDDPTQMTIQIAYDADSPPGWVATASGPQGSKVVCPKPCGTFGS